MLHLILTCSLFILNYLIITMNEQTTIPITIENEWQSRLLSSAGTTTEEITVYSLFEKKKVEWIKTKQIGEGSQAVMMYEGYRKVYEGNKVAIKEFTLDEEQNVKEYHDKVKKLTGEDKMYHGAGKLIAHTQISSGFQPKPSFKAYIIMTTEQITVYNLDEKKDVKYVKTEKLGKGSQAAVYEGYREDGERNKVAIKEFTLDEQQQADDFKNEVAIMNKLKVGELNQAAQIIGHTQIDDHFTKSVRAQIIMPLFDGDLVQYTKEFMAKQPDGRPTVMNYIQTVKDALLPPLRFLNKHNIAHLDIKPENILLKWNKTTLKITKIGLADFGLAHDYTEEIEEQEGAIKYDDRGQPNFIRATTVVASWPILYGFHGNEFGEWKLEDLKLKMVAHMDIEMLINTFLYLYPYICSDQITDESKQTKIENEMCKYAIERNRELAQLIFSENADISPAIVDHLRETRKNIIELAKEKYSTTQDGHFFAQIEKYIPKKSASTKTTETYLDEATEKLSNEEVHELFGNDTQKEEFQWPWTS